MAHLLRRFGFTLALLATACAHDDALEDRMPTTPSLPRMGDLPSLPFGVAESSTRFQRLWDGLEEARDARLPPPDVENEAAYRRYVERELTPWLERRAGALRDAEARLLLLVEAPDEERAIAQGLVASLNDETAEAVVSAAVPGEGRDPDRALAIRRAWRDRMAPIFEAGARHWRACAEALAIASPELEAWKQRCEDEASEASARQDN